MNADGSWKVTLSTKMGEQALQLHIATQGDSFTGSIESAMGNVDVAGAVNGSTLYWDMKITKPMSMKATYQVSVDGDAMSGTAKLGFLGKAKVSGERMTAEAPSASPAQESSVPEFLTGDSVDPQYQQPYIELNELRNEPVPHRYMHGGFKGTDARFSFYFPPADRYEGRFFHNTYPLALSSDIGPFPIPFDVATGNLGFTIDSGAYYVQTNLGGADRTPLADPAMAAYRVNAAAANYSRVVAAQLYGDHRPYGYLFGGSGGSYQAIGSAENTSGVWDGFVPFVIAVPNAIPSMFTVRMHALRILRQRNKFPGIVDAINPGGSGDPYAQLNEEERAALKEATLMGYPLRGWYNHETLNSGYFNFLAPLIPMLDPSYVEDFWTKPGYLGTDPKSAIKEARFQFDTIVTNYIDGFMKQLELEAVPDQDFADSHLVILSGSAAGNSIPIATINGNTVGFTLSADQAVISNIQPGDKVRIDNAWALALQTYHRHQVPTPDQYGWNQFRGSDGDPIYPQREVLVGPLSAAGTAGSLPNGRINGKMLVVEALMDIDALPWQADWYRSQVKAQLGPDFEDSFALWFIDHAHHDNPGNAQAHAHAVSFEGALQQALRDISTWVEKGVRPADTRYEVVDSQVQVPATAEQRGGIQPVIMLQANGGVRADVAVGETVTFTATIEVPPGAGKVVAAKWDFEGLGTYPVAAQLATPQPHVQLSATHVFSVPGTYFAVLRAVSQRQGDTQTPYGRIHNIARVRVVVKD
jgi:PKD domain-containing protein